ncbi:MULTISPECIES: hypothetical protein [unclassified Phycicoccus]|uniref:hypothetical protein n=1 Tax=unclassified Phycicoccus TaxID=2637926 RepID=UPI000703BCDF|nr:MULTISPECIES: hypothetical protein [unclassified Phycicoccus]KRF23877.1 hypothetical protein ASG95_04245 [Phycicoccus sp. Soil803]KRF27469.1 hypothetical protein ASG91_13635 [Phycicoccus sp. Soil802]
MSLTGIAEDPVALRGTAAQLRREADVIVSAARSTSHRAAGMAYAGPAADLFRTGITASGAVSEQLGARLMELAQWLETCAVQAEAEIAARRAAGLP